MALAVCLVTGCQTLRTPPLPPPLLRDEVQSTLRERAERIRTLLGSDIRFEMETTADGKRWKSPRFRGKLAFDSELPALWLLAEKVGRTAFSLRALADGFQMELPETKEVVTGSRVAYDKLPHVVRPEEIKAFFGTPGWMGLTWPSTTMSLEDRTYRFDVRVYGVLLRTVHVSRADTAISAILDYDHSGRLVTEIHMEDHEEVSGSLIPMFFSLERPLSGSKVRLWLKKVRLDKEFPRETFRPREKASWRHVNLDYQSLSDVQAFGGGDEQ